MVGRVLLRLLYTYLEKKLAYLFRRLNGNLSFLLPEGVLWILCIPAISGALERVVSSAGLAVVKDCASLLSKWWAH
jgi:hypothetical protein